MAAPVQRPEEDELKHLSKEARIQRLREFEELQRKRLEEVEREVHEELEEVEEIIRQEEDEEAQQREEVEDEEEESLEERIASQNVQPRVSQEREYQIAPPAYERQRDIYETLEEAAQTLENLYGRREWSESDRQAYRQAREDIGRAEQLVPEYRIESQRLQDDLSTAQSVLNRLQYRS